MTSARRANLSLHFEPSPRWCITKHGQRFIHGHTARSYAPHRPPGREGAGRELGALRKRTFRAASGAHQLDRTAVVLESWIALRMPATSAPVGASVAKPQRGKCPRNHKAGIRMVPAHAAVNGSAKRRVERRQHPAFLTAIGAARPAPLPDT